MRCGISRMSQKLKRSVMFACGDEIYGVTILATAKIIHTKNCLCMGFPLFDCPRKMKANK